MGNPYDFEPPLGTPAEHKVNRDIMFRAYASVPVPPGAAELSWPTGEQAPPPLADNEVAGPDGSEVRYYGVEHGDDVTVYATLVHPEGYAEFIQHDGGYWHYLARPQVMYDGLISLYAEDYPAASVSVPPPTMEMALEQAESHPALLEREQERRREAVRQQNLLKYRKRHGLE